MMKGMSVAMMIGLFGASVQAVEFRPMPAVLYQPRDGLGNVIAKLRAGETVRIGYLGGSITAQEGWRPMTLKWFQDRYPNARVEQIHAAIGGTPSSLGVYRFQQDVLRHDPDLVFVEFSVNDGGMKPEDIWRGMEGIVRQAWRHDPTIDICFVYTFRVGYEQQLDQGLCSPAASADEILAEHYGIPSINMALRVAELHREGKLWFKPELDADGKAKPTPEGVMLFSTDGVHPIPETGHRIYLEVIAAAIEAMEANAEPRPHPLPEPLMPDNWERAKLVPLDPAMLTAGWTQLPPDQGLAKSFARNFPVLWTASTPGEAIEFKFRGTAVKLFDIVGPNGGQAIITLDGETRKPVPRFDSYCTYWRLSVLNIADGLPDTVHTVRVEISPEQPDRSVVTDRERTKPNFDPAKYDGTNLWVGWIMLIGDIVAD